MKALVLGGTGKVGSHAVAELAASGARVRVMSRHADDAVLPPGCEPFAGDLDDPASLERAFEGVDRVAVIPPLHPEEGRILLACLGYVNWLVDVGRLRPGIYSEGAIGVLGRGSYVAAALFGYVASDLVRWARASLLSSD